MITNTSARGRDEIRLIEPPQGVRHYAFDPGDPALASLLARPLPHSFARESKATAWRPAAPSLGDVLTRLSDHKVGAKNGLAFVFADLPAGPRKKENVRAVTAVGLDLDDGAMTGDELDARIAALGVIAIRYTTHSHTTAHPKHRIIIPLDEPFDLLEAGKGDHRRGSEAWGRIPSTLGAMLEVEIDRACRDPARAFYLPRHANGAPWEVSVFGGALLDWSSLELAPLERDRPRKHASTRGGRNLIPWVKEQGDGFQIADAIQDYAEERIRGRDGTKLTVECPFDDHHSNPGDADDAGFFVCNAGEGKGGGFTAFCSHHHCQGRDRLDFLAQMVADSWMPESVLADEAYYPLPDDPAPVVESTAEPITLDEVKALTSDSDEAEVEAVAARIARLGPVPRSRAVKVLAKAAGIDAATAKELVAGATNGGREPPPAPSHEVVPLLAQIPLPSAAHGKFTVGSFDGAPWVFEASGDKGGGQRLYTPWGVAGAAVYRDRDDRRGLRLILLSEGSRLVEIDAPADLMADGRAFRAELLARGVGFTPEGGNRAAELVAQIQPAAPTAVYDRPGWRAPGLFLTPWGEAITAGSDTAPTAALARGGMPKCEAKSGSLEGWTGAVAEAFGLGLVQLQVSALAAFASPLIDLCRYESRTVFFSGAAGRGKSTGHQIQTSAWGDPEPKAGLYGSFEATPGSREVLLRQASGTGLALDEVKLIRGRDLQQFLFMVWSAAGRSRMDYGTEIGLRETLLWRCLLTSSYEDSLATKVRADGDTIMPGLGARVLEITADGTRLNADAVAPVEAVKTNYGWAGPAFVRAMFDGGYVEAPDALRQAVEDKADKLLAATHSDQRRAAITAALLWQAGEIALEAGLIPATFPLEPPRDLIKVEPDNEAAGQGDGQAASAAEDDPPEAGLEALIFKIWANATRAESAATDPLNKAVDTLIRNLVTGLGVTVADGLDGLTRGERRAFRLSAFNGGSREDIAYVIPVGQVGALAEGPFDASKIAKALDAKGVLLRYPRKPGADGRNRKGESIWPNVPGLGQVRALVIDGSRITEEPAEPTKTTEFGADA
jgi:hypothetical protein